MKVETRELTMDADTINITVVYGSVFTLTFSGRKPADNKFALSLTQQLAENMEEFGTDLVEFLHENEK